MPFSKLTYIAVAKSLGNFNTTLIRLKFFINFLHVLHRIVDYTFVNPHQFMFFIFIDFFDTFEGMNH